MALHPDFEENNYLYLYLTAEAEQNLINRVERYQLIDDHWEDKTVVLEDIAGASYHDGGRMEFGPEGYLYITTGDAGEPDLAQDTNSLSGKILRINDDGTIPEDNPFDNEVYSYGHRNPQGLAWDSQGRLWATEHGPSGAQSGFDELNLIKKGGNYGWPEIRGDQTQQGMINPVIQSGADDTWAPAGLAVKNGILFFAGLRGSSLYQAEIQGEELVKLRANFQNEYGRLRAVRMGPDGYLYFTTSNQDGRGEVRPGDDKLIRVNPTSLTKIEEIN
jgi:glucose/arabinose dehydrogenase